MIYIETKEYSRNNKAIHEIIVNIFNIPIFKRIDTTTHNDVINALCNKNKIKEVKGFKNETEN